MPPTSKENEVLVATPEAPSTAPAAGTFRPDETASRPSPVALEVPVSVNGARTVEGSDKREPFSETTKTVLVFGNGAVIRLSSPVSPGQLLFLTNEKTKKEVVCQVVKSKNYRNVSGYVELEFTESVVGFWGMRFPTDRIAAPATAGSSGVTPPQAAKPNPVAPAAPKVAAPAASSAPKAVEVRLPVATVLPPSPPPTRPAPVAGTKTPVPVAPQEVAKASEPAATPTIAASLASSVANLLGSPEVPPAATPKAPVPQQPARNNTATTPSGDASTEELKQQAARLQEQLSSMLFGAAPTSRQPATPVASEPTADSKAAVSLTSKVLEMAQPEPLTPPKLSSGGKAVPPIKSSLDAEEVKIPSWLEPLARNAAAPTSTQELVEREKARHAAELAAREREEGTPEVLPAAALPTEPLSAPEAEVPDAAGLPPLLESETLSQPSATKAKGGLWMGVAAAAVLAAAGGAWYFLHPTNRSPAPAAQNTFATLPASRAAAPAVQPSAPSAPQNAGSPPASRPAPAEQVENLPAATPAVNRQPVPNNRESHSSANPILAASTERVARATPPAPEPPAKPEPKKSSIGEVHLASPMVNRTEAAADSAEAAPTISSGTDTGAPGLASELGAASQPVAPKAPLPVGGDVKPAKLLSSTPPIYPALAKTQHIAGDVSIDALIDATGKVTTMKVLSGPTLLRQAAMDAVRQWKYQPASLDGSTVAMHLTVTVQFRMQ